MLSTILKLAAAFLSGLFKMFGGGNDEVNVQRELGRAEQQNADMRADTVVIRRANEAAKKVEQDGSHDPNDRDARR